MASIFTPTNFGDALGPYRIDLTDCMGDSVSVINANTNYLASFTAAVSSTASTQIASANTRITALSTVPLARLQAGGQTGNAPIFGARAWGRFDGTGANGSKTPLDSGNVSSINKIGTGNYTVTFAIPMPTSNYVVAGTIQHAVGFTRSVNMDITSQTTTSFQINTGYASTFYNSADIQFAVFC